MKKEELLIRIGKELIKLRTIDNDYSVEYVADRSKINKDTIYRYENGRGKSFYVLFEVLKVYGIELNIFFKNIYDRMKNEQLQENQK